MLRGASLRVTAARLAVLRAVHDHPHASTETVCVLARGSWQSGFLAGHLRRA
jgi:hypothetical protein